MIQSTLYIKQIFFCSLLFFTFQYSPLSAQVLKDTVIINTEIVPGLTDEDVTINLVSKKFSGITSFQFELIWDPAILSYQSVGNFGLEGLEDKSFGQQDDGSGLKVLWITNEFTTGTTIEEGAVIFSINFKRKSFVPHNVSFWGDNNFDFNRLSIEFVSSDFELDVELQSDNTDIVTPNHIIKGLVFFDENKDCMYQESELGIPNLFIQFSDQRITYSATTDSLGNYQVKVQPGNYVVKDTAPFNDYWEVCNDQDTTNVSFDIDGSNNNRNFPVKIVRDCPALSVNVSNGRLRRCFDELFVIRSINQGTQGVQDAYVIVRFDPFLRIVSSAIDGTPIEGIDLGNNEYRYDIGSLDPLESAEIRVITKTDCETTMLGQIHCVEAFIFPTIDCHTVSDLWSGATLELTSTCNADSLQFTLQNSGEGDMTNSVAYQVFENLAPIDSGFVQLDQGQVLTFSYPANGSTYRFQTSQVEEHPIQTPIFSAIEGCGTNEAGDFDKGFITSFSMDEQNPFYAIHCTENRGSFDPNDKRGLPLGYGPNKYIEQNQAIDYRIRFQNTGTDTAFRVVVIDTLSEHLNINSLSDLTSSHPYKLAIQRGNVLTFTFDDILLVDSFTNEPGSNGFISFKLDQQQDVPLETSITNQAGIYFDFNKPIFTNTTQHLVGKDFYQSFVSTSTIQLPPTLVSVQPNPFTTSTSIKINQDQIVEGQLYLYNQLGQQIRQYDFQDNEVRISNENLIPSVYFYEIRVKGQGSLGGKLMLLVK